MSKILKHGKYHFVCDVIFDEVRPVSIPIFLLKVGGSSFSREFEKTKIETITLGLIKEECFPLGGYGRYRFVGEIEVLPVIGGQGPISLVDCELFRFTPADKPKKLDGENESQEQSMPPEPKANQRLLAMAEFMLDREVAEDWISNAEAYYTCLAKRRGQRFSDWKLGIEVAGVAWRRFWRPILDAAGINRLLRLLDKSLGK